MPRPDGGKKIISPSRIETSRANDLVWNKMVRKPSTCFTRENNIMENTNKGTSKPFDLASLATTMTSKEL